MKAYDFDTLYPRRNIGAGKWRLLNDPATEANQAVFPFSVADMDFKAAPEICDALHEAADFAIYGYFSPEPAYYEAICNWQMRRYGFACQPEWLVQVPNIVYALYQLVRTFSEPGDGVIVQTPVYAPFFHAVERQQRRLVINPLLEQDMHYTIDFDDLAVKAADPTVRLMILCSPHNPVGRVWTREELLAIIRICQQHDVLLIVDEIHADLVFEPHRHTVLASLDDEIADNCMICTAPSKTFNLAGLSVANLIIPNETMRRRYLASENQIGIHGANYFGTVACQAAYEKGEPWYLALMSYLAGNKDIFAKTVRHQLPQFRITPLEGTYLGWIDMRALGLSEQERLSWLKAADLHFVTGSFFGDAGIGFERINLALPRPALQAGLDRLIDAVEKLT
ncbi:MAG: pyridoxal phosphate-dependent aminotransferase [Clostridiaceae bacterium]|jgi:putative C-S lyase|nr:pyridoxal phosphate-dependent aminotransferase [Clostridiaceae bacterium]